MNSYRQRSVASRSHIGAVGLVLIRYSSDLKMWNLLGMRGVATQQQFVIAAASLCGDFCMRQHAFYSGSFGAICPGNALRREECNVAQDRTTRMVGSAVKPDLGAGDWHGDGEAVYGYLWKHAPLQFWWSCSGLEIATVASHYDLAFPISVTHPRSEQEVSVNLSGGRLGEQGHLWFRRGSHNTWIVRSRPGISEVLLVECYAITRNVEPSRCGGRRFAAETSGSEVLWRAVAAAELLYGSADEVTCSRMRKQFRIYLLDKISAKT